MRSLCDDGWHLAVHWAVHYVMGGGRWEVLGAQWESHGMTHEDIGNGVQGGIRDHQRRDRSPLKVGIVEFDKRA